MSNKENTTSINIEGQIQLSSNSKILPKSNGEAKGIFIYEPQPGDFTNIDEQDLGNASFFVSNAWNADLIDTFSKEIKSFKSENETSKLHFGIALSYTGQTILNPLSSNTSPTNLIEHYAHAFNRNKDWIFRPIMHLGKSVVERETTSGLQYNLNKQLNYLESETTFRPIIHTSFEIAEEYLTDHVFAKFPLWLTNATSHEAKHLSCAWKDADWKFLEIDGYIGTELIHENNKHETESIVYGTNKFDGDEKTLHHFIDGKAKTNKNNKWQIEI